MPLTIKKYFRAQICFQLSLDCNTSVVVQKKSIREHCFFKNSSIANWIAHGGASPSCLSCRCHLAQYRLCHCRVRPVLFGTVPGYQRPLPPQLPLTCSPDHLPICRCFQSTNTSSWNAFVSSLCHFHSRRFCSPSLGIDLHSVTLYNDKAQSQSLLKHSNCEQGSAREC